MYNNSEIEFINSYTFINLFVNSKSIDRIMSEFCGKSWTMFVTFEEFATLMNVNNEIRTDSDAVFHFCNCVNSIAKEYMDKPINTFLKDNAYCVASGAVYSNTDY